MVTSISSPLQLGLRTAVRLLPCLLHLMGSFLLVDEFGYTMDIPKGSWAQRDRTDYDDGTKLMRTV